ncbi:MAG: HAMP domain-containing histidine kinase [Candidatus Dadabacteria bacterium]|nr:MAG: HAMP domain-containing histidine kinase [Candidatus Dadabacteria bacterium]
MPRTLFGRLLLHSVAVLAVFLAVAGMAGSRFVDRWETERVGRDLEGVAWAAAPRLVELAGGALQAEVRRLAERTGLRVTVIRADGVVLADSHRDPATMENHAGRPEVREALAGRVGHAVRRSASIGEPLVYVAVPATPVVRVARSLASVAALQRELRKRLGIAAILGFGVAFGLAAVFSRNTARRLRRMTEFATRAGAGDLEAPLAVGGADELADLERALGGLRDALREELRLLRAERARLHSLLDHLPDGILVLGRDGRIRMANPAARRILRLGHPAEDRTGAEALRHPDLLAALARCQADPAHPPDPVAVTWPDPPCRLLARFVPHPDEEGGAGVLVVLRDVTRQHELERMRRDFVANLAHELRTPLTAIRGAAETLPEALDEDPGAAARFLESIRRNARRLEALLQDVAELARIEAGAAPLRPERVDARAPVRTVVEMFSAEAERAGVDLAAEVPPDPVEASIDPEKLESILINLVQNAVRYTPAGGRARVRLEARDDRLVYRVEDTGIGIPPSEIPRVTERFYRVDPGRSRATGGTGLGLAIVKHLTELMGGALRIEPLHPQGTRVTVTVPRDAAAPAAP